MDSESDRNRHAPPAGENSLLWIMDAGAKAELMARCRATTITRRDLATVIHACAHPLCDVLHASKFSNHVPDHLHLSEVELADMGEIEGRRPTEIKGFRKIFAQIDESSRRVGHLFAAVQPPRWWLVYFTAKDTGQMRNHWNEGAHVHLLCWLTHPKQDVLALWRRYCEEPGFKMPSGIHVRMEVPPPRGAVLGDVWTPTTLARRTR